MLKKLFIKNYENVNDANVRNKYGKVAGMFAIFSNLLLGTSKVIIGLISNSISIMADAINNLSDMASGILTILGFKFSDKKPSKLHPYGYARYEYIAGFTISIIMCGMGFIFAKESIMKIIHPEALVINIYTIIVLFLAIIIKFVQMRVYFDFANCIKSRILKTTGIDSKNDIITTSTILFSMIIMSIFKINIDGYSGLLVSLFVIYSSIKAAKEVIDPLIGIIPSRSRIKEIKNKIRSYENVIGIHDLMIHNYGEHNDFATVHVEIDSQMDVLDSHELIDIIERDFKEEYGIDLTIHMDPVIIGNEKIDKLKHEVIESLKEFDKTLKIHDFRVTIGRKRTKIIFDCVIPYNKEYNVEEIKNHLKNTIKKDNYSYVFIVELDRPIC